MLIVSSFAGAFMIYFYTSQCDISKFIPKEYNIEMSQSQLRYEAHALCTTNHCVIIENISETTEDKLKLYIYSMKEHRVLFNHFKVLVLFK